MTVHKDGSFSPGPSYAFVFGYQILSYSLISFNRVYTVELCDTYTDSFAMCQPRQCHLLYTYFLSALQSSRINIRASGRNISTPISQGNLSSSGGHLSIWACLVTRPLMQLLRKSLCPVILHLNEFRWRSARMFLLAASSVWQNKLT